MWRHQPEGLAALGTWGRGLPVKAGPGLMDRWSYARLLWLPPRWAARDPGTGLTRSHFGDGCG